MWYILLYQVLAIGQCAAEASASITPKHPWKQKERQGKLQQGNPLACVFRCFFHPMYYLSSSPYFSSSFPLVTQIRGHLAGTTSPTHTLFHREKRSAFSSLVDSRRVYEVTSLLPSSTSYTALTNNTNLTSDGSLMTRERNVGFRLQAS